MDTGYMFVGILVMSAVTYLIRALPIMLGVVKIIYYDFFSTRNWKTHTVMSFVFTTVFHH